MKKLLTKPVFLFNTVLVFVMAFALFGIAQAASWQDSYAKSIANAPLAACPTSGPWLGKWSSQGPGSITIAPGENQTLYVYFTNIGTSTWYNTGTDKVGLFRADEWDGQNDFDQFDYPDGLLGYYNTRVTLLDSPSSVAPNGLGYFAFRITPKTSTALGTYRINLALGRGGDTGGGPWIETNVSGNAVDCMSRVWYPVVVTLAAPTLSSVANSDGDGNYTVSWSASTGATRYEIQEDDNSAFSSPTTVYNGSNTSFPVADKSAGAYYYHAKACSSSDCSSWSSTRSVTVLPEWDATPVGSIVFTMTIDGSGTSSLITPQYRNTGWRTWPVSGADRVILSYRHEDGDQNGDSNWSSITESAFRCSDWPPDNNWWAAYLASATSKGSTGSFPFQFCNTHGVGAGTYRNHFDIAYGSSWFYPGGWVNRITVNITVVDSPQADPRLYAGLSATPSSLKQGEALNASYTIKNYGSQSITFNTVTVSCRSPKGVSCDFGPQYDITLIGGQTYPLNANSSSFGIANDYGTYVLQASYKLPDGSWADFPTGESGTTPSVNVQVNNPDPSPNDCAQNVVDVTYPDGTKVEAGATFNKIWRLENCGSTIWGSGYQAVRVDGAFGPASFNVSGASGLVEIGSDMTAPTTFGLHKATYQLQGPNGFFGPQFWVEIKVVTSEPPDLGFRPNPDGYSFSNYGGVNASDFTTEDMRAMFGDAAVCQTVGAACTVLPAASDWNTWVNGLMDGGHCDGFTTTSLRFYTGIDNPATYQTGAQHAYDLQLSNIRRRIAYFWILQVPSPVATARSQALQKTPSEVLDQLRTVMAGGVASDPTTLIIYNAEYTSGHSVAPYAVEDRGNGVWWVKVYDNNHPNDANRHVVITTATNTWSYDLGWVTWDGDASTHSLGAIPISEYAKSPTCPWCTGSSAAAPVSVQLGQMWYAGPGNLLVTDRQGRRIGFNGSQFVNEIPGAFASVIPGGLGTATQPIYYLPITGTYTMLLDGQAVAGQTAPAQAQTAPASFAFFGPGYAVSLADNTLNTTAHNLLRVAPNGIQLAYQPSGQSNAAMAIALDGATQSYRFDVGDIGIAAGQALTLTANTTNGKLTLDNSHNGAATYDLKIARVSAAGKQVFAHSNVAITATDTQLISYGTWNGTDEITVQIDRGSDGTVDQTIALDNQLKRVYLPLIRRNP